MHIIKIYGYDVGPVSGAYSIQLVLSQMNRLYSHAAMNYACESPEGGY